MLLFFACAPRQFLTKKILSKTPGSRLFLKAEEKFETGSYDRALELYIDFLRMYPESELAPSALYKIGAIRSSADDYEAARKAFRQIITDYPESMLVSDARIDILAAYYSEGRYGDVIDYASEIDDETLSDDLAFRKHAVLADANVALGSYKNAAGDVLDMYARAPEPNRHRVLAKLDRITDKLGSADMLTLLDGVADQELRCFFMYSLAQTYSGEGDYESATEMLSEFVSTCRDDERTSQALHSIEAYEKSSEYEKYTIGCLFPLSGKYEAFGGKALRGVELALDQFVASHEDVPIRVVIKDTKGDPDTAVEAVLELEQEGVAAVIGPILTAHAASEVAQARGIPMITLTQKDNIAETGDYIFRNFLTPEMQIKTTVSYAVNDLNLERFAILYPDEKYGTTYMNLFWDEVISYGGELVGVESYAPTSSDFAEPIKKLTGLYYEEPESLLDEEEYIGDAFETDGELSESEPPEKEAIVDFDAIFIPEGPEKAALILPQLTYHDVTGVYLLGTNLWHTDRLIAEAGEHVDGAIMPDIFFADSENPAVNQFVRSYSAMYSDSPGFLEALSYDTAMILFHLAADPDIRFRMAIKNELLGMAPFPGATGLTRFGPDGDVLKKLFLLKVYGRRFVELEHNF